MRRAAAAAAIALTRLLLVLYPPSFRRDVGRDLLADVECRARHLTGWRVGAFLVRLTLSHLFNAGATWAGLIIRPISWVDLKLAFRMLVKFPALSLVGGLGMAVAVAIGVGFFALFHPRFYPDIPLSDGDRLVALQNRDRVTYRENRNALYDFGIWRAEMTTVEDLAAFRTISRNAIFGRDSVDVVEVAEITPSGFRLARVAPLIGRTLLERDAAADAPPVAVIGHDVWRASFLSDRAAVGQTLRLGDTSYTIVGVMPEGFAFPVNHRFWIPMKMDPSGHAPGGAPPIFISGRLAPGVDREMAQAELRALGERLAGDLPDTHGSLRPEIVPYTYQFFGGNPDSAAAFWPVMGFVSLILVIVCVNVAILVYARTVNRLGEIAVRMALGASRRRIVAQLFLEALVLSLAAAGAGLLVVRAAVTWAGGVVARFDDTAFWTQYTVSGEAIAYGFALAALAAVITGVVPALRATGRRAQAELRLITPGGGLRMGRVWSTLIVTQVTVASAGLPVAVAMGGAQIRDAFNMPAFPVDDMVFAYAGLESGPSGRDPEAAPDRRAQRFERDRAELARRLAVEPGVAGHSFTLDLPLQGSSARIVLEHDDPEQPLAARNVAQYRVDQDFFGTFDLDLLAGRALLATDIGMQPADVVVVDRAFVEQVLDGDQAVGRRIRVVSPAGGDSADPAPARWLEIVGVVNNLETNPLSAGAVDARVYRPFGSSDISGSALAVRLAGADPNVLGRRLVRIAAEIDPAFRLTMSPVGDSYRTLRTALTATAIAIGTALLSVILLAAAGIYALMAFTVARRRREFAIRTALGASPGRLLGGILGRAIRQIALGIAIGLTLAVLISVIEGADEGGLLGGRPIWLLAGTMVLMGAVGFLATFGPARRGMRIQPAEVLKGA